jgi:hypothetical protein
MTGGIEVFYTDKLISHKEMFERDQMVVGTLHKWLGTSTHHRRGRNPPFIARYEN